tara:strand:- start:15 stop:218 length:204 start_codon:yes stop_codon:yes gene_type:complete
VFSAAAIYIMAFGSNGKLFFGVEARDFQYFNSWSIFFPFLLLFLAPALLIITLKRNLRELIILLLLV